MSKERLQRLRAALNEKEKKKNFQGGGGVNYPFWKIKSGEEARIRFLEDKDPDNDLFWVVKEVIKLPFTGVEGEDNSQGKTITVAVPTMSAFKDENGKPLKCEICAYSSKLFDEAKALEESDPDEAKEIEKRASSYWKKKSGIFQGFVRESPFNEKEPPENPIRRFTLNKTLLTDVEGIIDNMEIEYMPTDEEQGTDYVIKKTKQGQWDSYTSSYWSRRETPLTDEEKEAIEKHGLWNLADYLPAKPTKEELDIIHQMFEDSKAGELYSLEKYGNYYLPFGYSKPEGGGQPTGQSGKKAEVKESESKPAATESKPETKAPVETEADTTEAKPEVKETAAEKPAETEATAEAKPEAKEPAAEKPAEKDEVDLPSAPEDKGKDGDKDMDKIKDILSTIKKSKTTESSDS